MAYIPGIFLALIGRAGGCNLPLCLPPTHHCLFCIDTSRFDPKGCYGHWFFFACYRLSIDSLGWFGWPVAASCHDTCHQLDPKGCYGLWFFFTIILALIHWALDTHWIIFLFTSTLLLFFSEDTDDAAQYQYSCTCNRPAGNEFVVATCSGCGATSLVEYMGSVPAKFDIVAEIVESADLR